MEGEALLLLLNRERLASLLAPGSAAGVPAPELDGVEDLPRELIRGRPFAESARETLPAEEEDRIPDPDVSFLLSILKMPALGGGLPPSVDSDRKRLLMLVGLDWKVTS